jgi:Arc/MetJ family transcription regulator
LDRFRRLISTAASATSATQEETDMSGKKALVAAAVTAALVTLGAASAAASDHERGDRERGGSVRPCSLAGVNPVHHPEIFGNAAAAQSFGFVLGPDGGWRVSANCRP